MSELSKLIAVSIIVYSCIIVLHGLIIYFVDSDYNLFISDQLVFYNRGTGILKGDIPYRDFYTQAAPLSPYLWAPIVLISMIFTGQFPAEYLLYSTYLDSSSMIFSSYIFRVFFSICLILSAVLLFKILDAKKNKRSFWIALCYSINPYFLYLVTFWGSDECIVPLLIILPIYLLEKEKYYLATLSLVVGAGLKYFPILLLPLFLIYNKNIRKGLFQVFFALLGITATYLPFYFVDSEAFKAQFNYPLDNARNQGISAFFDLFTKSADVSISNYVFLGVTIFFVSLFSLILLLDKKKWTFEDTMILLMPFLLFFPKIQFSYFVIIFPFIFITLFKKGNIGLVSGIFLLSTVSGGIAADYILTYDQTNLFTYISAWIITVILYVSMISLLILKYLESKASSDFKDKEEE